MSSFLSIISIDTEPIILKEAINRINNKIRKTDWRNYVLINGASNYPALQMSISSLYGMWLSVWMPARANARTTSSATLSHDYITKPFSVEELLARIRVTQRRLAIIQAGEEQEVSIFINGQLKIDYTAGCTYLKGKELHLTPIEYKLLCLLSRNVGKVLTHTYITQQIWGNCSQNDVASLRVFMATLRKKLEPDKNGLQYIQTHIGIGYRMLRIE